MLRYSTQIHFNTIPVHTLFVNMCNLYVLIDIFEELVSVVVGEDVIALVEFVCDGWIGYSAYMSDL